jgi:murein DD-endopeptidase MepM/ murein hydrolase activator NlpD
LPSSAAAYRCLGRRAVLLGVLLLTLLMAGDLARGAAAPVKGGRAAAKSGGRGGKPTKGARARKKTPPKPKTRKQKIQRLRNKLSNLKQQKAEQRAELRVTKRTQRRLADQLNETYERLETARDHLRRSKTRLATADRAVRASSRRLAGAEKRLRVHQRRLSRRIASSYQEGAVTYTDVVLGSRSLGDFLDRRYYVSRVMHRDAELLSGLRLARQQVALERRGLLERKATLAEAHHDNQQRLAAVTADAREYRRMLRSIAQERALQEQRLAELEEDSQDVQRALAAEMAQPLANPGGYRALPGWSGKMFRPANGPIRSRFGVRYHPVLKYYRAHTGVDIGAPPGAPVFAAAAGEVFSASWRGGYGRCIILLHGGGVSTLYGHLSGISVQSGQTVRRGQVIGAVGSTGLSTGPHLHFEVRRNGAPVNPL